MATGLKGLTGIDILNKYKNQYNFSSLSQEQQAKWLADNAERLKSQNITNPTLYAQLVGQCYRNDVFKSTEFKDASGETILGESIFNKLDYRQRDALLNDKAVQDAFDERYKDDSNYWRMNSLTTAGKEDLFNRNYLSDAEYEEEKKKEQEAIEATKEDKWYNKFADFARQSNALEHGMLDVADDSDLRQKELKESFEDYYDEGATQGRANLLQKIIADDDRRAQEEAQGIATNIMESWQKGIDNNEQIEVDGQKMSYLHYINDTFDKIAEDENSGSRHYRAFKDAKELENFSLHDKMEFLANYMALTMKFNDGGAKAMSNLDTQMQDYISDNQSGWRWAENTLKNVGVGGCANLANKVLGLEGLYIRVNDGEEAFANWLEGKDKDGNTRNKWNNAKYWNGVDQFNTFDEDEIRRAEENGGISPYQNITRAGEELSGWATANEALKMTKFLWSDYLTSMVLGGISRGLTKGVGGISKLFGTAGAEFSKTGQLLETSGRAAKMANKLAAGTVAMSGVGISQSYGMQTYTQTLQEATELLNAQFDKDANNYAQSMINTPESQADIEKMVRERIANGDTSSEEELRRESTINQERILANKYKEDNKDSYEEDLHQAKLRAADAFAVDATIEEVRMALGNYLFKSFLFDKGTRAALGDNNPFLNHLGSDASGALNITANKAWVTARKVLTPVWGGFQSNYLDDVTVGFGKGFGLGEYNNYLAMKYNPEKAIAANFDYGGEFISGLDYAVNGAKEASMNKQSFYDGFVGALGSITSFSPRIRSSERAAAMENMGVKEGDKLTFAQKFNKWVMNPLVDNYYDAQGKYSEAQKFIDDANKTLTLKKDAVQDITNMVTALNMREANTGNGKSTFEAKNAKAVEAFQLVDLLNDWEANPILSQSSLVQNAQSTLEGISKGTLEQGEMDALINQFLAQGGNKSVATLPNARDVAAQTLKKNADQLLQMQEKAKEVAKTINKSKAGRKLTEDQKKQLVYQQVIKDNWVSRLSEIEQGITGRKEVSTGYNITAEYGSLKAWERKKNAQEEAVSDIDSQIKTLNEKLDKVRRQKASAKLNKKGKYKDTITSLEFQIKAAQERKRNALHRLDVIKKDHYYLFTDSEGNELDYNQQVLSTEEILSLSPEQRAWMLADENLSDYSIDQQDIIKATVAELVQKDPDIMEGVMDAGRLNTLIADNDAAYAQLTDAKNAEAAATWAQMMAASRVKAIESIINSRAREEIEVRMDEAATLDEREGNSETQPRVKAVARSLGYAGLRDYIERHKVPIIEEEGIEGYMDHPLEGIARALKVQEDAVSAINTLFKDNNVARASLSQIIHTFTNDAESEQQAMSQLEDAINAQDDEAARNALEEVMKKMEELKYQRDATKITARQEEIKRKQEEAFNADGKNFGWDDYHIGDKVFNETRGEGVVVKFSTDGEGGKRNMMEVRFWNDPQASTYTGTIKFNSDHDKGIITKNVPTEVPDTGKAPKDMGNAVPVGEESDTYSVKENLNITREVANRDLGGGYTERASDESVNKEEQKKVQATADYLNGKITSAKDYLAALGYSTGKGSWLESNNTTSEDIEKEAKKKSDLYSKFLDKKESDYAAKNVADKTTISVAPDDTFDAPNGEEATMVGAEDVEVVHTPDGDRVTSPTVEEQAKADPEVEVRTIPTQDLTDQGNRYDTNSPDLLAGNYLMGQQYNAAELAESGKQTRVVSTSETRRKTTPDVAPDRMETFQRWLAETKTRLQDIVDNELGRIISTYPETKIQFLQIKPEQGSTLQKEMIEVIEYTSKVKKFHDENNGGVITANGKEWLVVGVNGFTNVAQRQNYNEIQHSVQVARKAYFDANPAERYYVDPVFYTNFDEGTSGYIVKQLEGDSEVQIRKVGDLADGKKSVRNPEGLKLEDLKWGIQEGDKFVTVGITDISKVYPPRDKSGNSGNTFLLVKAANGNYIPIYVKPVMLNELEEGSELKNQINTLINDLTSPEYNDRLTAIKQLVQMLNLDKNDNILIGDKSHPTVTIVQNGNPTRTFTLDANFNRGEFQKAIESSHFRVNITTSTLQNPTALKMYNDAGALTTDVAKLGTSNMVYSVYPCGRDGKPVIKEDASWSTSNRASDGELSRKYAHSVLYNGKVYREREGIFYNEVGKPIDSTSKLYTQLYWNQYIQTRKLEPTFTANDTQYYIIRNSTESPLAIKIDSRGNVTQATTEESMKTIEYAKNLAVEAERVKAAKEEVATISAEEAARADEQMNAIKEGKALEKSSDEMMSEQQLTREQAAQQLVDYFFREKPATDILDATTAAPVAQKPTLAPQVKRDVNETGSKSLSSLQSSAKIATFAQVITDKGYRTKLRDIFKAKGWEAKNPKAMEEILKSKGISLQFDNVEDFLKQIEECF